MNTFHNRDIQYESLKGSNILAQGNALGKATLKNGALKGRDIRLQTEDLCFALSGLFDGGDVLSQGVALG